VPGPRYPRRGVPAFTPALLILAAAPLSFAGALLMLLVTGTELNVSSAMGFICWWD
jgi:Cu/Ag efflux pump CusA